MSALWIIIFIYLFLSISLCIYDFFLEKKERHYDQILYKAWLEYSKKDQERFEKFMKERMEEDEKMKTKKGKCEMSKIKSIKIINMSDTMDCETCGCHYASGYNIVIDGSVVVDKTPYAHCYQETDYPAGEHNAYFDLLNIIVERMGVALPISLDYNSFVHNLEKYKTLIVTWIEIQGIDFVEETQETE